MKNYPILFSSLALVLLGTVPAQALVRPIAFPVDGPHSFRNDFSEPRGGGTREHLGIDIITKKMTPVVAAADGEVSYVVSPQASWGYSITIRDAEGYQYRYLHLNNDTPGTDDGLGGEANAYAPGIERGASVKKGQLVGWAGDSGNAEEVGSHLHFEIRDPERTPINPYESLIAADAAIATSPSMPATPPSTSTTTATSTTSSQQKEAEQSLRHKFEKSLSVGSRGEDVRQLQIALKALGYFTYPTITGYFGSVTKTAVIAFQRKNKIDPIGIVGPKTRAALNAI